MSAQGETVNGGYNIYMDAPGYSYSATAGSNLKAADFQTISANLNFAQNIAQQNGKNPQFIYINRCDCDKVCVMYVTQKKGNSYELVDKSASMIGGAGIGCGKNQSEPGIFEIQPVTKSGETHGHWGPNKTESEAKYGSGWDLQNQLMSITPIRTNQVNECGNHDTEKVIHSRLSVKDVPAGEKPSGQTAGCIGLAPDDFVEMGKNASKDKPVIYNVNACNGGRGQ